MFIFYIYEHLSLGVTLCVFVGKGDAGRWRRFTALIKNWLVVGNVAWMMSWNCPDSDAVIYHTIWESRTRASVKKRKIDDKDKFSQAVLCSVGCVHVHPHVLARKANKCTFGYFLFRLGCYTNLLPPRWCIVPPALHQYVWLPFLWIHCSCLVNIFAGRQVVIPVEVPHSPGLPEMNPSISRMSLCICAERKHDQLLFGTSLNKILNAWTTSQKGLPERGRLGGWVRFFVSLWNTNTWIFCIAHLKKKTTLDGMNTL